MEEKNPRTQVNQQIEASLLNEYYTFSRSVLQSSLNNAFGNHDVDTECGYPTRLDPDALWKWFKRGDIASRIVTIKPETCWSTTPTIYENEDVEETAFEKEIKKITVERKLWSYLGRADIVSGVGSYSIILLGIDDGKDFAFPVEGMVNEETFATKKHNLKYIRVYSQHQISIAEFENDPTNPRFGLPRMYQVKVNNSTDEAVSSLDGATNTSNIFKIHWTRVIHVADNRDVSDIYGNSRLQRIYNRLIDIKKTVGGGSEMFWKGAFPGLALETQPNYTDASFDKEATREAIFEYQNGLQRYLAIAGINVKTLTPQISDPTNTWSMLVKCVCLTEGVPYRILLGSEEAKLAGEQDTIQWNRKMETRRTTYLDPYLVKPVIDRLQKMRVLSDVEYKIKWEPLNEQTLSDQINNALNRTKATAEYIRGGVDSVVAPKEFFKHFLKLDEQTISAIEKGIGGFTALDALDELEGMSSNYFDPNGNPGGQQNKPSEDLN